MTTDTETTMEGVRRSIESGPMDEFIERMAERVGAKASVRAVFGDPIERDGITIIPVARVRWGFGGGAGTGPLATGQAIETVAGDGGAAIGGSGGGGGVIADPVGYLEIGPEGATFRSITDPRPSPGFLLAAGATVAIILRGVARIFRR